MREHSSSFFDRLYENDEQIAALPKPDQDDLTKESVESLIDDLISEVGSLPADNELASQDEIAQ